MLKVIFRVIQCGSIVVIIVLSSDGSVNIRSVGCVILGSCVSLYSQDGFFEWRALYSRIFDVLDLFRLNKVEILDGHHGDVSYRVSFCGHRAKRTAFAIVNW